MTHVVNTVTLFDDLVAGKEDEAVRLCAEARLPAMTCQQAREQWVAMVAALRQGVVRWTPRPPLEADAARQLTVLLAQVVDGRLQAHVSQLLDRHRHTANEMHYALTGWNSKRLERLDRPSPEAIAAMSESGGAFDTFEYRTADQGNRVPVYRLRPSKEDLRP
jgi:hypothetical protein